MSNRLPLLAGRMYGQVLMIEEGRYLALEEVFRGLNVPGVRVTADEAMRFQAEHQQRLVAAFGEMQPQDKRPYQTTADGVAIIPVMGPLVQRGSWMDSICGISSYDDLDALRAQAEADPKVRAIFNWIDSPGGEVSGVFSQVERWMALRDTGKPSLSFVDEMMASAAYALGVTADEIWAPSTGLAGSIGTIIHQREQTARNTAQGYTYTIIRSGDNKALGGPHEPLSDGAKGWMQGEASRVRDIFAAHVDAARGLEPGTAYDTQASIYSAPQALERGLIDRVGPIESAMQALVTRADAAKPAPGAAFSLKNTQGKAKMDEKDLDKIKAEAQAAGQKLGASAERTRIKGILASDAAASRPKLAQSIALDTDLSAEQAAALLSAAQPEVAQQAQAAQGSQQASSAAMGNLLSAAMAGIGNPRTGPAAHAGGGDDLSPEQQAAQLSAFVLNAGKGSK